jgi:hypothetical protein
MIHDGKLMLTLSTVLFLFIVFTISLCCFLFSLQNMLKPSLLCVAVALALCASFFVTGQTSDVAVEQPVQFATHFNFKSPPSSAPFQPFRLDDWGAMYLDYWRGEPSRSSAQVIALSLLGLFAAFVYVVTPWRKSPSFASEPRFSMLIRTLSSGARVLDARPSDTLGSVKQQLQVSTCTIVTL